MAKETQNSIDKKLLNLVGTAEENRKIVGAFNFLALPDALKKSFTIGEKPLNPTSGKLQRKTEKNFAASPKRCVEL